MNESLTKFVYKFYQQSTLVMEEYLPKRGNAKTMMPLDVLWSIL